MSNNRNLVGPFVVRNNKKNNFLKFPGTQEKAQFVYNNKTNKVFLVMRNPETKQIVVKNFGKTMTQVAKKPNVTLMFQNKAVKERTLKKLNNLRGLSNNNIKHVGKNSINVNNTEIINNASQLPNDAMGKYTKLFELTFNPFGNNSINNLYKSLMAERNNYKLSKNFKNHLTRLKNNANALRTQ